MTRPIDWLEPQQPTRDKLDETAPAGWYECRWQNSPERVVYFWNGSQLLQRTWGDGYLGDDDVVSEVQEFSFTGPLVHAPELQRQLAEAKAEIERLHEAIAAKDNLLLDLMETKEECTAEIYDLKVTFDAYRERFGCLACGEYHPEDSMCPPHEVRQSESYGSLKHQLHNAKQQLTAAAEREERANILFREVLRRAEAAESRVKELESRCCDHGEAIEHLGAAGYDVKEGGIAEHVRDLIAENAKLREQLAQEKHQSDVYRQEYAKALDGCWKGDQLANSVQFVRGPCEKLPPGYWVVATPSRGAWCDAAVMRGSDHLRGLLPSQIAIRLPKQEVKR